MLRLNNKWVYLLGFLAIIIVYSLYNIFFDLTLDPEVPRIIKHANKLLSILLVYGIGMLTLRRFATQWMMQLWHIVHFAVITILLCIGFYDWYNGSITNQMRDIANTLHDFLISPVLYAGIGIIKYSLINNTLR
ncbi:MAG TPA: hypothetical protein VNS32_03020 [Flavisolibacter sp.]|nr:hypothetical protein [Flavisolibacter sp.]